MFRMRKGRLLEEITTEKARLNEQERRTLSELRRRILRDPHKVPALIQEGEYAMLTEAERDANGGEKRIDYILSLELQYLISNRTIPRRLLDWFKGNKLWLLTSHAFGGLGAALVYYVEHKEAIDRLLDQSMGQLRRQGDQEEVATLDLRALSPKEVFERASSSSLLLEYFGELSARGLAVTSEKQLTQDLDTLGC
jgi:hypothetical protein